jgi:hypothetical protein
MDILWKKVKEEPVLFTFLGLTVGALGGGLRSLATGDKRASQTMMRARVFFQLCTVCTLVGTVYWKAYTGETSAWGAGRCAGPCPPPPPHTHTLLRKCAPHSTLTLHSRAPPYPTVMGKSRPEGAPLPDYLSDPRTEDAVEVWESRSAAREHAAASALR